MNFSLALILTCTCIHRIDIFSQCYNCYVNGVSYCCLVTIDLLVNGQHLSILSTKNIVSIDQCLVLMIFYGSFFLSTHSSLSQSEMTYCYIFETIALSGNIFKKRYAQMPNNFFAYFKK